MKRIFFKGRFIFIPILAAVVLSLVSFVVMQLWNNLLPAILHVGIITFWQAMGIFILCKILFGFGKGGRGWGNGGGGPWMRRRMEEKFKNMTPEEKERFKQKMAERMCGGFSGHHRGGRFGDWEDFKTEAPKATE
ncbi:hypothetical protein [Mucilaginibacter sp. L196]|uniref:hypothetical protein n=1 Tax=Mucilaginibacter sp. L196 TaxID=1641870 RepID=UPI001C206F2C|nr:hypothetical protein [Mucilaginibacter sp. L196]